MGAKRAGKFSLRERERKGKRERERDRGQACIITTLREAGGWGVRKEGERGFGGCDNR